MFPAPNRRGVPGKPRPSSRFPPSPCLLSPRLCRPAHKMTGEPPRVLSAVGPSAHHPPLGDYPEHVGQGASHVLDPVVALVRQEQDPVAAEVANKSLQPPLGPQG